MLNTPYLDGGPIQSPDGAEPVLASNRPRFVGDTRTDLDIWAARRDRPGYLRRNVDPTRPRWVG
jgi:hypothetical protein